MESRRATSPISVVSLPSGPLGISRPDGPWNSPLAVGESEN